uniref:Atg6 BARA domain-containing protein n=1 Tax=Tetranychus urticae TaxID=32264 RepID=T1KGX6_TETUR
MIKHIYPVFTIDEGLNTKRTHKDALLLVDLVIDPRYEQTFRIQYNSEEEWTKALKYMLTNLKWILTWVARPETSERCDSSVSTTK